MSVGWNLAIDGRNSGHLGEQSVLNRTALISNLKAIRPGRIRFHRPLYLYQGTAQEAGPFLGDHAEVLSRLLTTDDPGIPLDYYPHIQIVIGYGCRMADSAEGFTWAQLAGFGGDVASWIGDSGGARTDFLNSNYKTHLYGSRPPEATWQTTLDRFNAHMRHLCEGFSEAGWPVQNQEIELWNECLPSGIGGRGIPEFNTPWDFDPEMIPMLDFFARGLNLNPDGRGRRKLIASTLVAWNGTANMSLIADPDAGSRYGSEIARSLACIDEWAVQTSTWDWDGLFDAISLNPYAPPGDNTSSLPWGCPNEINVATVNRAVELKMAYVKHKIRNTEAWFQHLPIIVSEFGMQGNWCSLGTQANQGWAPLQSRAGKFREASARYMASLFGDENVCVHTFSETNGPLDMEEAYNMAELEGVDLVKPACFQSARPFLTAAGWDASGATDPSGMAWLGL